MNGRERLFELLAQIPDPAAPPPRQDAPAEKLRLHLFSTFFRDVIGADRFCYAERADDLTPLRKELAGVFLDPDEIEMVFGDVRSRLLEFLPEPMAEDILLRMEGDNTLIIITDKAFGGPRRAFTDTPSLIYLGPVFVDV